MGSNEQMPLLGQQEKPREAEYFASESGLGPRPVAESSLISKHFGEERASSRSQRINSLDVFRGFVIFVSLVQPMVSEFRLAPPQTKHMHYFLSWADLTMPFFYVAIGFAMQLTLTRLRMKEGLKSVVFKQLQRSRTLWVFGFIIYGMDSIDSFYGPEGLQENWWKLPLEPLGYSMDVYESLTNIAVGQLAILPVITRGVRVRASYALLLAGTYLLCLRYFWFKRMWLIVDGGILGGAFSHSFVILCGTFLYDFNLWTQARLERSRQALSRAFSESEIYLQGVLLLAFASGLFIACGIWMTLVPQSYGQACFNGITRAELPCQDSGVVSLPFVVPDDPTISMWTMSHRSASISGQLCAIGLAYGLYLVCYVASDIFSFKSNFFVVLSTHSLLIYILREYGFKFTMKIIPSDSPLYMIPVAIAIALLINVNLAYYLARHNINLRL